MTSRYRGIGSALLKCPSKFFSAQTQHFSIPQIIKIEPRSEFPTNSPIKIGATFLLQSRSTRVQIPKSHRTQLGWCYMPSSYFTCGLWVRIIYIGKGCIYSPFLIKRPQPQRSYLDNVSQYTGLKPATTLRACMPRLTLSLLSTGEIVIISPNCQQAFPTEFKLDRTNLKFCTQQEIVLIGIEVLQRKRAKWETLTAHITGEPYASDLSLMRE